VGQPAKELFESQQGKEIFLFSRVCRLVLGGMGLKLSTQTPFGAEVKNESCK